MITLFMSSSNDSRDCAIREAIDIAEYNLGMPITVYPTPDKASWCLAKSNLAEELASRLHNNGFDMSSARIFMLRKDIHTSYTNWCFGATTGKTILISDYRVWFTECTYYEKVAMLVYLIEHEVGHAYGVADDIRAEGIYDYHCFEPNCVMQQVISMLDLRQKAKQVFLAHKEPGCFCEHCRRRFARL